MVPVFYHNFHCSVLQVFFSYQNYQVNMIITAVSVWRSSYISLWESIIDFFGFGNFFSSEPISTIENVNAKKFSLTPAILYHCKDLIRRLRFCISRQVLHFCICNFGPADKANWALSPETKLHILVQKHDGLENIENPSRALEVILGSSTNTNSGHNHTKNYLLPSTGTKFSTRVLMRQDTQNSE